MLYQLLCVFDRIYIYSKKAPDIGSETESWLETVDVVFGRYVLVLWL